jgi:hypothetical protein
MTIQSPSRRLRLFILSLSLFCSGVAAGQSTSTPVGPPNVRILSGDWHLRVIKPGPPGAVPNSQTVPHEDQPIEIIDPTPKITGRTPPERVFVFSTEILNTGPKEIKSLSWTYSFVQVGERRRRIFTGVSFDKIRVNQRKTLETTSHTSPSKVINVAAANGGVPEERVAIECLLFADGSSWQNPMSHAPACDMLRRQRARRR